MALDPRRTAELNPAAQLAKNAHLVEIYRMMGQAMWVLLIGVAGAVIAVLGYLAILASDRKLEDTLRDFAKELTVCLLRSPLPPPARGSHLANDEAAVPAA
jgi:hypothetical protein